MEDKLLAIVLFGVAGAAGIGLGVALIAQDIGVLGAILSGACLGGGVACIALTVDEIRSWLW